MDWPLVFAQAKLPLLGGCWYNHLLNEPPSGLVEDVSAMGPAEPNLDLHIAIQAQKNLWTLQRIPKVHSLGTGPCVWGQ